MDKTKFAVFGSLFVLASFGLMVVLVQKQTSTNSQADSNVVNLPTKVEAVSPTPDQTIISPDGKSSLTMKTEANGSETTYSFYTNGALAFTKTTSGKMSVPYNTWSIDDKHFFVREDVSGQSNFYIEPGDINLTQKFNEKFPNDKLQEATGWAAENLVVVNANNGRDISFWFDITNETFISLATRFN